MKIKELSYLMKGIVIVLAIGGAGFFFAFMPLLGLGFVAQNSGWFWAWVGFLFILALPLVYILVECFLASCDVGKGKVFTRKNVWRLRQIAIACGVDGGLLLVGSIGFLCLSASNLTVFFTTLFLSCELLIIATAAGCLASFVMNGTAMREENESFI